MIQAPEAAQDEGPSPSPVGDPEPADGLSSVQFSPQAPDPPSLPTGPTPVSPSDPTSSPHTSYLPAVAEDPEATNPQSEIPNPQSVALLTQEERRQILARIARYNPLDCLDETGAFDLARARLILPPGSISHLTVHETTRPNAEGQTVTERRIDVRLFNPVSALRLDEQMERRRQTQSSAPARDPYANFNLNTRKGFNLLREKTMALDDTLEAIEQVKKTIAEIDAQELLLTQELEEKPGPKDLSLSNGSKLLGNVNGDTTPCNPALQSRDQSREAGFATPLSGTSKPPGLSNEAPQGDTGQPVQEKLQTSASSQPAEPRHQLPSKPPVPSNTPNPPRNVKGQTPAYVLSTLKKHETQRLKQEVETARNSMGPGAFATWLRNRTLELATDCVRHLTTLPSARPPP